MILPPTCCDNTVGDDNVKCLASRAYFTSSLSCDTGVAAGLRNGLT